MKLNKQYILVGLLFVSLCVNIFQVISNHNDRVYAQLWHNQVAANLAKAEVDDARSQVGGSCQTVGSLQAFPVGVLTCSPKKIWERARCDTKGLLSKEDFGMILTCDGAYWRGAHEVAEPMPGDACGKEGEMVLLHGGDGITCTEGKYVVTMLGPSHSVGAPCFGPTGTYTKPDKFGMVCRDGKFRLSPKG